MGVLLAATAAAARMAPPTVGAVFVSRCKVAGVFHREYYRVKSVDGDIVHIEVGYDSDVVNEYRRPYHLSGTTVTLHQRSGAVVSTMSSYEALLGIAALNVGSTHRAWVLERRSGVGRLNWNYTVRITGTDRFVSKELGEVDVYIIAEERWVGTYKSDMLSYYAPKFNFPVYWKYSDTGNYRYECTLTDVRPPDTLASSRRWPSEPALYVTVKNANVRVGPATSTARITTLAKGTRVTVLQAVAGGHWVRVGRGGKPLGYIYRPLLEPAVE
jgi:uncharacterized protein YgiM (DUF1202 family)